MNKIHYSDWHYPSCLPKKTQMIDEHQPLEEEDLDVALEEAPLAEPPMYSVVMYNDDYTPMDFVVMVLMSEFKHNETTAIEIMMNIHKKGKGIAGTYPKDIAETKADKVNSLAQREGFPLKTQIEPNIS